jgi:hypothetical protein
MAGPPYFYSANRLETAAAVTVSGVVAAQPAVRLFDRGIGLRYQDDSASGTRYAPTIDQGGSPRAIDTLIVGPDHNLSGVTATVGSSTDNNSWTAKGSGAAPAGAYVLDLTAFTTRYARVGWASPGAAPILTELWLSQRIALSKRPTRLDPPTRERARNVTRLETRGGGVLLAKRGAPRWGMTYAWRYLPDSDVALLEAWWDDTVHRPSWFVDHLGTLRWVEVLTERLTFARRAQGGTDLWDVTLAFQELLG